MARTIPEHRFDDLVRVATEVFIAQGYRHTQMAEIAKRLGVAKGTLYVYVESKEALYALCLRHADNQEPLARPAALPIPTPKPGELRRFLRRRTDQRSALPIFARAAARRRAEEPRAELEAVVGELYDLTERNHRVIKLIDRAVDHPEISAEWQAHGREEPREALAAYISSRVRAKQFRPVADPMLAARLVIETVATWAMHIHWDPSPQEFDAKAARGNAIEFLVRGLVAG